MKFIEHTRNGDEVRIVNWGDHWPGCDKCRTVTIDKPATLANACAQGSPLLMEELAKRQAPEVKKQAAEVKAWAEKAGTFKMGKSSGVPMRYVEDK